MACSAEPGRPRPHSVSGVFPAHDRLLALLPLLEGADRRVLVDLPRALHVAAGAASGPASDSSAAPHTPSTGASEPVAQLADLIRRGTAGLVDPRDVVGYWDVISRYGLAVEAPDHTLCISRRGRELMRAPEGRVWRHLAGREGLLSLLGSVAAGHGSLAALLPGWRDVLQGNPRFAAAASHPRSLGQRVASLVRGGWLHAHGDHAQRLADETGFRRREAEPAFATLGGGLSITHAGRACLAPRRESHPERTEEG